VQVYLFKYRRTISLSELLDTLPCIVYRAVIAHPPKTINGKFRVTEQGEMITQNFGSCSIAERTMDIYTAAVLAEKFCKHIKVLPEWRNEMERLSEISCEVSHIHTYTHVCM
jgi:phosphoenolpyruvate carboxylase